MKHKFKVGDRVVANKNVAWMTTKDKIGTVIGIHKDDYGVPIAVEFDEYVGGHSCRGIKDEVKPGKYGHCAWCGDEDLEFVKRAKADWKVVIIPDGDKTIGKLIEDGKTVKKVTTKKHPDDKYDMNYAIKVVTERLVEPKYYNGKIVCVDTGCAPDCLTVGKIYTVVDGYCKDDQGRMMFMKPVTSFDEIKTKFNTIKFIEVVE